ncbi:MAG: hypothetical protein MRZ79_11870 [Bacteroidia bacterium]|nr:hypothetical protein [Bacteroidia bacterium]
MKFIISILLLGICLEVNAQVYPYEASPNAPFGLPNPNTPAQIKDFQALIGECNCKSLARGADQSWGDTTAMIWRFKYIMNGKAVQDETLKADGTHSGSIRQFNADSAKWYVHYYTTGSTPNSLPTWEGGKMEDGKIILYRPNKAPNGQEGFYRITFYDIDKKGFKWIGEWVDTKETIEYPLWKIFCKKK